jgi:hypothetical protein
LIGSGEKKMWLTVGTGAWGVEIKGLDGERKALVYDNYSKLIAATETIGKVYPPFLFLISISEKRLALQTL